MNENKIEEKIADKENKPIVTKEEIPLIKPVSEEKFFDKHKTIKITILLLIIIFSCYYIRAYEASMPALDKAAEMDLTYLMIEQVRQKMYNPLADPAELQKEMQDAIKRIYKEKEFKQAVKDRADVYKARYKNSKGESYLVKADTYYYLRQARELSEDKSEPKTLFPNLIYYTHKISSLSLIQTAYYLPLLFAILSCVVVFFLTARFSNYWGGFFAGIILAIHPVFLDATSLGYPDTQILNLFFSLLIAWFFILLLYSKKRSFQAICGGLLLFTFYLFKLTWSTYFYMLFVIFAALAGYVILKQLKSKSRRKWVFLSIELAALLLFLIYLKSTKLINLIMMKLNLKISGYYPSALTSVQELGRLSLQEVAKRADILLFLISMISLVYIIYKLWKKPDIVLFFLTTWFVSMMAASFLAARLFYFFILPLVVVLGYGLNKILPCALNFPKLIHLKISKKTFEPILVIFILLIIIFSVKAELFQYSPGDAENAGVVFSMSHRLMDDSIEKISKTIMTKTKADAVINLWWDLGHIYRYYSRRNVILDGADLTSPKIYWFAKALTSTNETEARDILHMISCNSATNKLIKADCDVPDSVVIISDFMIKRNPVILKTAEWDFKLASIYDEIKDLNPMNALEKIKEKYPSDDADEIYSHMMQYTSEQSESKIIIATKECARNEDNIVCDSLTLDLNQNKLISGVNKEYSFRYVAEDEIISKDVGSEKTIFIYYEGKRIRYASVDSDFIDSLLVRLYFLEARDLEHFELLDKASYAYAKKIKAFWVRWEPLNNSISKEN